MDKVTQQNAAMVEQATAAAQNLSSDTDTLANMVSTFRTAGGNGLSAAPRSRSMASAAPARPRPAAVRQMRTTTNVAPAAESNEWAEF